MHIPCGCPERAMFIEIRLPHAKLVAGSLLLGKIRAVPTRIRDDDKDVDDRFYG